MLGNTARIRFLVFSMAASFGLLACGRPGLYYETANATTEEQLRDWPEHLFTRNDWLSLTRDARNGWRYVNAINPDAYREPKDGQKDEKLRDAPEGEEDAWLELAREKRNQARLIQADSRRLGPGIQIDELLPIDLRAISPYSDGTYERARSSSKPPHMTAFVFLALLGGIWCLAKTWAPPPQDSVGDSTETPEQAKYRWIRTHRGYYWAGLVGLYVYVLLFLFQHDQMLHFAGVVQVDSPRQLSWPVLGITQVTTWLFVFPLVIAVTTVIATGSNLTGLAVFLFLCVCQTMLCGVFSGQGRASRLFFQMARTAVPMITFIITVVRAIAGS